MILCLRPFYCRRYQHSQWLVKNIWCKASAEALVVVRLFIIKPCLNFSNWFNSLNSSSRVDRCRRRQLFCQRSGGPGQHPGGVRQADVRTGTSSLPQWCVCLAWRLVREEKMMFFHVVTFGNSPCPILSKAVSYSPFICSVVHLSQQHWELLACCEQPSL